MSPDGAGALVIPWEALAAQQPGRGDNWWEIHLAYARPGLVTATGWMTDRAVVVFEGTDPGFVAAAIATYAAEPGRRHAIGTLVEQERLQACLPPELRGTRPPVVPEPTRATVRRIIVGLPLLLGAGAAANGPYWLELLAAPFGVFGAQQLYQAFAGRRAARREHAALIPGTHLGVPGKTGCAGDGPSARLAR